MYILIIARGYPTEKYKMNGIFEFDQAKALAEAGHKVVYAAVDVRSLRRWRKWGIEKKKIEGVNVYAINIPCGRIPKGILQNISSFGLNVLYKVIEKEQGRPDVMHAHFAGIGHTASKLHNKTGIPFVITEHYSAIMKPEIDIRLFHTANGAYRSANAIIAVSPSLKNIIKKRFNKEAIYIPNIVDTKVFNYRPQKNGDDIFRFVSVGSLKNVKRMDLTIEAFVRTFKDNEKVTLTIFGEGPERSKLEGLISKYHVSDRVKLMGLRSREEIAKFLKKGDCFVLASQSETFGVAFIEALASGLPVIATKCGGPECIVNNQNGIFVPVNDLDALSEAMKYMYNNINKFDRQSIARETKKLYSPSAIAIKLKDVYEEVIEKLSK